MFITPLSISNGALRSALSAKEGEAAARLPKRLKLLNWGVNDTQKGAFHLDLDPETFSAFQRKNALERVAIDFEHNTVPGSEAFKASAEPRPVAGYGSPRVIPGDGLWLEDITWTPEGLRAALNFEDLSPAPLTKEGRVYGLHSAALTRAGAVYGLTFFSAEWKNPQPSNLQPSTLSSNQPQQEKSMDADVKAALEALAAQIKTLSDAVTALAAKLESKADPETLSRSEFDTVKGELIALSARQTAAERKAVCDRAAAEGKVIPLSAEDLAKASPDMLSAMVEKLPVTVPLSRRSGTPAPSEQETLSATGLDHVAKLSGYSVEQLKAKSLKPNGAK